MSFARLLAILGVASALVGPVSAADMIDEIPQEIPQITERSGWYLRGDIGFVVGSDNQGDWDFYNILPGVEGTDDVLRFDHLDFGGAASFAVGVGYRFNEMIRTDLTLDYFKADIDGKTRCPFLERQGLGMPDPVNGACDYNSESSATIWNPMLNAYADLGTFSGITPYIGLGVGAALVDYGKISVDQDCPTCNPALGGNYQGESEGLADWRFAGAAMVGAAYNVSDRAILDIGYKYTRVGSGDAWAHDAVNQAAGASGAQTRDNGFDFHALRAGIRYEFN